MSGGSNHGRAPLTTAVTHGALAELTTADDWRRDLREEVLRRVGDFVATRCATDLAGADVVLDVLRGFVDGGKCLRSTFLYVGWLCRGDAQPVGPVLDAAASLELLHAFALLQDDVMDRSATRRGRPAAHVGFASWHRANGLSGSPERFGESAAVLLGDLCLVWAERMLRESGLDAAALDRAWPRYDEMRTELAVGQFADLVNDAAGLPPLERVLDVARRKSGNYTVRRPLEIGGALADCSPRVMTRLSGYGDAVGEAFQLRDDLLGVFGTPAVTGKPIASDLTDRKATSVVVAAHHLADATTRREMTDLMNASDLSAADVERWRRLIAAAGAPEWIEQMIDERLAHALDLVETGDMPDVARTALADMAAVCTDRAA
ncbi:polyprenyl synthetase family protein [Mycolicibacterium grossiae]|uniref:Polyprenyl synthetase n=1 Tax=Mycolicibacterium grossiae TaxID=1552759 RepID=A0A1E8Q9D1_9MYCO|nr:polyprenyl synthetase family protein [Mycolicibacterium grossiae]OFJ54690.1 polyprenyl synthetase [Mycolicibacterium grossiae]QEM46018.1 polyprenyl synthetase family protein [Mycolicibacterium grossiae]